MVTNGEGMFLMSDAEATIIELYILYLKSLLEFFEKLIAKLKFYDVSDGTDPIHNNRTKDISILKVRLCPFLEHRNVTF